MTGQPAKRVLCPCCMHSDTIQARKDGVESTDDIVTMIYLTPRGCSVLDGRGAYKCMTCLIEIPIEAAAILIDAAVRLRDPGCDSIIGPGLVMESLAALGELEGG